MALQQTKLTRAEWNGIEVPLPIDEKSILAMLVTGYNQLDARYCNKPSMLSYMKMDNKPETHDFIYETYFRDTLIKLLRHYSVPESDWPQSSSKKKLKKADVFRVQNTTGQLEEKRNLIVETILLDMLETLLPIQSQSLEWCRVVYAVQRILSFEIPRMNTHVVSAITRLLRSSAFSDKAGLVKQVYTHAQEVLITNPHLKKVSVCHLYDHQKELFAHVKRKGPKLLLLRAPTGTGKTVSPLGLLEGHRILFVCGARHVGLSLARSAINMQRRVAFAFNCASSADIRLHYYAAKECIRDRRSGAIRKVDNSVGDNVEIIISDLRSCVVAMYYMLAFNKPEQLLLYWDEPTISLDRETHPMHETVADIWNKNTIPNVVFSSATLPSRMELQTTCHDFSGRFDGATIYDINSSDYNKSIAVIDTDQRYVTPHNSFNDYAEFRKAVSWCVSNPTVLRYLALEESVYFVKWVEKHIELPTALHVENSFTEAIDVTVSGVKQHYLELLKHIGTEAFELMVEHFHNKGKKLYDSSVLLTTSDAHTLTNGPTIYLARDVDKIARFLLQQSKIPGAALNDVYKDLEFNRKLLREIDRLEKQCSTSELTDGPSNKQDSKKNERDIGKGDERDGKVQRQIRQLQCNLRTAKLHNMFVPNTKDHLASWCPHYVPGKDLPFQSNISEAETSEIMSIKETRDMWKLLLLMGIGVLENSMSVGYTEKMKALASEQKLYLLIAADDYIYGTNYQFGHVYIGKDLASMTQDKILQAVGRVGRELDSKQYTVRVRDNAVSLRLFSKVEDKPEVRNMARLFISADEEPSAV